MARDKDRELEELFSYGVDRKARRIYFGVADGEGEGDAQDVGWSSVEQAVRGLHLLMRDSLTKPIEFHVYSWGGDVYAMFRMIDEIEACPCQIKFFGGGRIASAMTWIMAVCDERWLHKNTTVMLHDGCDGMDGKHTDVQIDAKHGKDIQDTLDRIFADNSRMPIEFWQDVLQRDMFITAEECIALGLADKIIPPKSRGNLRRARTAIQSKNVDPRDMRKLVNDLYKRINRKKVGRIEINTPRVEEFDSTVYVEEALQTNSPEPGETLPTDTPEIDPLKKT